MVDRPEDVGGPVDVEPGRERAALVEPLDDRALVRVVLGLDARPERADLGVGGCGAPDHLDDRRDAPLALGRVARVQAEAAIRVGLLEHLDVPRLLGDGTVGVLASQEGVPHRPQHAALRLEREVDGLQGDAGLRGDRRHRRRRVALPLEQPLGGGDEVAPGCVGLRAPPGGLVSPPLDVLRHSDTLSEN